MLFSLFAVFIWRVSEVVVTRRTRNAVVRKGTWVRIPHSPLENSVCSIIHIHKISYQSYRLLFLLLPHLLISSAYFSTRSVPAYSFIEICVCNFSPAVCIRFCITKILEKIACILFDIPLISNDKFLLVITVTCYSFVKAFFQNPLK